MTVNTIRVIDFIMPFLPEPVGDSMVLAQRHLNELVDAYDALAPTPKMWAQYPWAQWYTIDANGASIFSADEPFVPTFSERPNAFWDVNGKLHIGQRSILLPLGIDWRLCKWQRPEVK